MRYNNVFLFLLLSLAWGSAFNFIKVGLNYFPPVLFASFRYFIAGSIMLMYAYFVSESFFPRSKNDFLNVIFAGVFVFAFYHSFLFIGELRVSSSISSVIVSLSPVLTTVFVGLMLPKERLDKTGLLGLGIGFIGVFLLISPDLGNVFSLDNFRVIIFLAAFSFAFGSVLVRYFDCTLSIESMEAWSMILGALIMLLISLILNESLGSVKWEVGGFLSLFYLSLFSSSIGFLIYFNLLQDLGPIEVNLVSYSAPVFATFIGVNFLNEKMSLLGIFSLILIFIGFILLKREKIRTEIKKRKLT